jgi:hypothetical protein
MSIADNFFPTSEKKKKKSLRQEGFSKGINQWYHSFGGLALKVVGRRGCGGVVRWRLPCGCYGRSDTPS